MKIISFTDKILNGAPVYYFKTDNCLLRNNKDFYIPDSITELEVEFCLLVKFKKIGKFVEPKFVDRYFSQIALGVNFYAKNLERELSENNLPLDISYNFDNSSAVSIQLVEFEENQFEAEFNFNDQVLKYGLNDLKIPIASAIEEFSKYTHVKIGDYLYIPFSNRIAAKAGDKIYAKLNNRALLNFGIK